MNFVQKAFHHKLSRFIFSFLGLYLLIYYFTVFWIGVMAKGNVYWQFADQHMDFISGFRYFLLHASKIVCTTFGYEAIVSGKYVMHIKGGSGIRLVYSCLGYGIMSFYVSFILAWPKKGIKEKWFPLIGGLAAIIFLNILRLALLAIIYTENPNAKSFPVDHHDVFNFILYAVIAGMLHWWLRPSSFPKT